MLMNVNLAETIALSHKLLEFAGIARVSSPRFRSDPSPTDGGGSRVCRCRRPRSWRLGGVRGTKDVDIVIAPDPENLKRVAAVSVEIHGHVQAGESSFSSHPSIAGQPASGEQVAIETDLGRLDVVQGLDGVPGYEDLQARQWRRRSSGQGLRLLRRGPEGNEGNGRQDARSSRPGGSRCSRPIALRFLSGPDSSAG
jgi:hypothetical protein